MKCHTCQHTLGQSDIYEGGKPPVSDGMPGIRYYYCQNDGFTRPITRKAPREKLKTSK